MDVLRGMTVFIEVAKQKGFASAARALNLSTSSTSRYVTELEDWLGVQLLQRTTRRLHLTNHGKAYLEHCKKLVAEVATIKQSTSALHEDPQGRLRITAPVFIAKNILKDLLPTFLNQYPLIEFECIATDRYVNLIEEDFDMALRAGELDDSTLVSRKLMDIRLALVASPLYLKQHGEPKTISDLKTHNCLIDTGTRYVDYWPVYDKKSDRRFRASGNVQINSGEIILSLALSNIGIALLPDFFVQKDIHEGNLVSLLESKIHFDAGLFAIYPSNRHLSRNVRSFIDFLVRWTE
jgi:DNA-binding transcriptional LysR family regulator